MPSFRDRGRFLVFVDKKLSGCWHWIGTLDHNGYGKLSIQGIPVSAPQFSYRAFRGLLIEGLDVAHLCTNKVCVNPDHLAQQTKSVNMRTIPLQNTCRAGHNYDEVGFYSGWLRGRIHRRCKKCVSIREKQYHYRRVNAI